MQDATITTWPHDVVSAFRAWLTSHDARHTLLVYRSLAIAPDRSEGSETHCVGFFISGSSDVK